MAYALEYAGSSSGAAVGTFQMFMDLGMVLGPLLTSLVIPMSGYTGMFLYFHFYVIRSAKGRCQLQQRDNAFNCCLTMNNDGLFAFCESW
jgi:hypothetical protein